MYSKKKVKYIGALSKKRIIASVRKEMARPRIAESAQIGTNKPKQRRPVQFRPTSPS